MTKKSRTSKGKKAPKMLMAGKYACVVCDRTAKRPVYCCGPLAKLHTPKKMHPK